AWALPRANPERPPPVPGVHPCLVHVALAPHTSQPCSPTVVAQGRTTIPLVPCTADQDAALARAAPRIKPASTSSARHRSARTTRSVPHRPPSAAFLGGAVPRPGVPPRGVGEAPVGGRPVPPRGRQPRPTRPGERE